MARAWTADWSAYVLVVVTLRKLHKRHPFPV
jgi:hypothetical protein